MSRGDSFQERLWTLIQKRKQARSRSGSRVEASPSSRYPEVDALLVDVLYQALRSRNSCGVADASAARMALQGAIAADRAPRAAARPARRGFWQLGGRKQLLLAVALLLITAAALACIAWSARSPACAIDEAPSAPSALPTVAPAAKAGMLASKPAKAAALAAGSVQVTAHRCE